MSKTMKKMLALFLVPALALLVATGCGGDDDGNGNGNGNGAAETETTSGTAAEYDLSGASVTVGSKEFTEQLILGSITIQALEAAGADVTDQTGLEGSVATREALSSGDIDMYWEYTGTAWVEYLGEEEGIPDEQEQYQAVAERDESENDITWLDPTPFNNTYAFAIRSDAGEELDEVETISDLADLVESNPELATICVGEEFATRPDGLPGVEQHYGFEFPEEQVSLVGDAVVYDQVASGDRCNFGSVFATDGRIEALDLRVLEDDENFFPFFNAALTVRNEVLEENPEIADLFNPIVEDLTEETMTSLNARVDVEGEPVDAVAADFLAEHGYVE